MYICEVCGVTQAPYTPSHRIVLKTRTFEHPFRRNAHQRPAVDDVGRARRAKKKKWHDDSGGLGAQIVTEVCACPSCYAARQGPEHVPLSAAALVEYSERRARREAAAKRKRE